MVETGDRNTSVSCAVIAIFVFISKLHAESCPQQSHVKFQPHILTSTLLLLPAILRFINTHTGCFAWLTTPQALPGRQGPNRHFVCALAGPMMHLPEGAETWLQGPNLCSCLGPKHPIGTHVPSHQNNFRGSKKSMNG